MDVSAAASVSIGQATEWIDKVLQYLKHFKPEIKSMTINYRNRNAEVGISIFVPNGIRRRYRQIEIPRYNNFVIDSMMDDFFTQIPLQGVVGDKTIKINCSNLPGSEKYLLRMKGTLPQDTLNDIVYIQPAKNKDRIDGADRYWLNSSIKNVESLEALWNGLNVNHVTAGVNIGIERYLSAKLPARITRGLEAVQNWASAGYSMDREKVVKAWLQMHSIKNSQISVREFFELIQQLTANEFFSEFIEVDLPYNLGEIRNDDPLRTLPENMYAEACTRLTLKEPIAEGFMTFKKQNYLNCVEKRFNEL